MNVALAQDSLTKKEVLSRSLFQKISSGTLFFLFAPLALFLSLIGLSLQTPSVLTPFMPLLGGAFFFLCVRYKTKGLIISYAFLGVLAFFSLSLIPSQEQVWQMGALLSLSFSLYIALLSTEEIEAHLQIKEGERESANQEVKRLCEALSVEKQNGQEEALQLEKEIIRLTEEVELKQLDRESNQQKLALFQSQMTLMSEQKEEMLKERQEALELAKSRLARLEGESEKGASFTEVLKQKTSELLELQEKLSQKEHSIETLQTSFEKESEKSASLSKSVNEKIEELNALKEALSQKERSIESLEASLQKQEEAPSKEAVIQLQESVMSLQQKGEASPSKDLSNLEGKYQQLRQQFKEKADVLSETRQALFRAEEKLLASEHAQEIASGDSREFSEEEIRSLLEHTEALEEEVKELEGIISTLN